MTRANYLLFPGGMPEALALRSVLGNDGAEVIGASSIHSDPAIALYTRWLYLPFVEATDFAASLKAAIEAHAIGTIFTSHPVIARRLQALIAAGELEVRLSVEPQGQRASEWQRSILARIESAGTHPFLLDMTDEAPALNRIQQASLMHHALQIEGSSSDEKLIALMEIARTFPKGDIVEIGTFWGRSAAVLAMLAGHYGIGPLLCLDPWANAEAMQAGVTETVNDWVRTLDFEVIHRGFLLSLFPYAPRGQVNFLREDATAASQRYQAGLVVESEAFGRTVYGGGIACLHIDGNHGLEHVRRDIELWSPRVVAGGWIIIDDYQWAFGDGPCVAADQWMQQHSARIARAFVTGSALFIRLL